MPLVVKALVKEIKEIRNLKGLPVCILRCETLVSQLLFKTYRTDFLGFRRKTL
jgi:hypothetical protein